MIAGIVLAAGRSRRMGRPKAFLTLDGATFLARAVAALRDGGCGRVVVVAGPEEDDTDAAVAREARALGADVAVNPAAESEQIDSLRVGLRTVDGDGTEAAVCLPVDVPGAGAEAVAAVIAAFRRGGVTVARAAHGGRHGHPVLFARAVFPELLAADLPDGARGVVRAHAATRAEVEVGDARVLDDVDTPDDYRRLAGET